MPALDHTARQGTAAPSGTSTELPQTKILGEKQPTAVKVETILDPSSALPFHSCICQLRAAPNTQQLLCQSSVVTPTGALPTVCWAPPHQQPHAAAAPAAAAPRCAAASSSPRARSAHSAFPLQLSTSGLKPEWQGHTSATFYMESEIRERKNCSLEQGLHRHAFGTPGTPRACSGPAQGANP